MSITWFTVRIRLLVALVATGIISSLLSPYCFAEKSLGTSNRYSDSNHIAEAKAIASARGGVLIEWRTGFQVASLGFNIFRERNGLREKLNPSIIAGPALIAGSGDALSSGFSYSWFDAAGTINCKYDLTEMDLTGRSNAYPPVIPESGLASPAHSSELLCGLGADIASRDAQSEWSDPVYEKSRPLPDQANPAMTIGDQWEIANQPALKIGIRNKGFYRVTQPEMAAAGFDTGGDARNLRMFVNATEIAIRVSREGGALTSNDYIEFWGEGLDTTSTDTQIYWLVNGAQAGKRINLVGELQAETRPSASQPKTRDNPSTDFLPPWFVETTRQSGVNADTASVTDSRQTNQKIDSPLVTNLSPGGFPQSHYLEGLHEDSTGPVATPNSFNGTAAPLSDAGSRTLPAQTKTSKSAPLNSTGLRNSFSERGLRRKRRLASSPRFRSRRRCSRSSRKPRNHAVMNKLVPAPAFIYNVERKDRKVYFTAALNGPAENFFGQVLSNDPPPLMLTVHNVEPSSTLTAQLQVSLRGVTIQNHTINVSVNNEPVGALFFSGQNAATQNFSFPLSTLIDGDNAVKLTPAAGGNDVSVVDYVRITYPHSFRVDNDFLQFTIKSTQSPRIEGFTTANVRVFDVTDNAAVQEIHPLVESSGARFAATISPGSRGKARQLVAMTDAQLSHPASLTLNAPSTLSESTNTADLLIISYRDFIPALAPLVSQRRDRDGFVVKVVDVEDVYDEFSYGTHDPQSIKDFLKLAASKWTRAPRYVLLVGDASYDPRNYLGKGFWDFVPSMHVDTTFMEADSDDSLADFDDDGIPELAIGRLPARSVSEANVMVSKIVNFSSADVPPSALMVADNPIDYDFEAFDEHLITLLPTNMTVQRVYRSSDPTPHDDIISKINQGVALVNYSGHGNINIWAGPTFSSNDALALNNGKRLPFVTVMDCLNGFFSDPVLEGVAESLLKAPNGGAVASFASSGLTTAIPQHEMGERLFQLIYGTVPMALGDASRQAKSATQDLDVRRTWILFGDPSMKIR